VKVFPEPAGREQSILCMRKEKSCYAITSLAVHHNRGCGTVLNDSLHEFSCSSGIHLGVVCLLSENCVESKMMVVHEHMDHISLHPSIMDNKLGASASDNIVFLLLDFVRKNGSFAHANTHVPSWDLSICAVAGNILILTSFIFVSKSANSKSCCEPRKSRIPSAQPGDGGLEKFLAKLAPSRSLIDISDYGLLISHGDKLIRCHAGVEIRYYAPKLQ
jgi:hypothetical protein